MGLGTFIFPLYLTLPLALKNKGLFTILHLENKGSLSLSNLVMVMQTFQSDFRKLVLECQYFFPLWESHPFLFLHSKLHYNFRILTTC